MLTPPAPPAQRGGVSAAASSIGRCRTGVGHPRKLGLAWAGPYWSAGARLPTPATTPSRRTPVAVSRRTPRRSFQLPSWVRAYWPLSRAHVQLWTRLLDDSRTRADDILALYMDERFWARIRVLSALAFAGVCRGIPLLPSGASSTGGTSRSRTSRTTAALRSRASAIRRRQAVTGPVAAPRGFTAIRSPSRT